MAEDERGMSSKNGKVAIVVYDDVSKMDLVGDTLGAQVRAMLRKDAVVKRLGKVWPEGVTVLEIGGEEAGPSEEESDGQVKVIRRSRLELGELANGYGAVYLVNAPEHEAIRVDEHCGWLGISMVITTNIYGVVFRIVFTTSSEKKEPPSLKAEAATAVEPNTARCIKVVKPNGTIELYEEGDFLFRAGDKIVLSALAGPGAARLEGKTFIVSKTFPSRCTLQVESQLGKITPGSGVAERVLEQTSADDHRLENSNAELPFHRYRTVMATPHTDSKKASLLSVSDQESLKLHVALHGLELFRQGHSFLPGYQNSYETNAEQVLKLSQAYLDDLSALSNTSNNVEEEEEEQPDKLLSKTQYTTLTRLSGYQHPLLNQFCAKLIIKEFLARKKGDLPFTPGCQQILFNGLDAVDATGDLPEDVQQLWENQEIDDLLDAKLEHYKHAFFHQ